MISISNLKCIVVLFLTWLTIGVSVVSAQQTQTLSVSPTLFDITANPEQVWQSTLRVINPNDFDLVVYPQVVNFNASGESGQPRFEEIIETETMGTTLGEWVVISEGPITVPEQQTVSIPFSVTVPADANPGGHYAAILVGTRPPTNGQAGAGVQTSQFVTALLFLRVDGDVIESAKVREFTTGKTIYQTADVDVILRLQNDGNVHVQPQGDIVIKNMWGEERGIIPVNQRTQFGKILRDSTRAFEFNWRADISFFDIGRYSAEVTLAYGESSKQFVSAATYFWVVPITSIALVLGSFFGFILIIVVSVRLYVRRILILAGVNPDTGRRSTTPEPGTIDIGRYERVTAPLRSTVRELKSEWQSTKGLSARLFRFCSKLWSDYRRIVVLVVFFGLSIIILVIFRSSVTESVRNYEVTMFNDGERTETVEAEAIIFNSLPVLPPIYLKEARELTDKPSVSITNLSGELGVGARLAQKIRAYDIPVVSVQADFTSKNQRTIILYQSEYADLAFALSRELGGVLISAREESNSKAPIEVRVGADMIE